MYNQYAENTEKSLFNEGTLQIQRLHNCWLECEIKAKRGLLDEWNFVLDGVWRELIADINRLEDSEKILKTNILFNKKICTEKDRKIKYQLVDMRHQWLKVLQDKVGKGTKYVSADSEHFL
jgi:hypothetical protein